MRKPVLAGNWKMYKTASETSAFLEAFIPLTANASAVEIVICPPYVNLAAAAAAARGSAVEIGGQDVFWLTRRRLHGRDFRADAGRGRMPMGDCRA